MERRCPRANPYWANDLVGASPDGRDSMGLTEIQKQLLLDLSLWKVRQLLMRPFRYRTQCFLGCENVTMETEMGILSHADKPAGATENIDLPSLLRDIKIGSSIKACGFNANNTVRVLYPAIKLYKAGKDDVESVTENDEESEEETNE